MKVFLKVLKAVLYALGLTALVFFVVYDIITQQNRIESSYFFLNMVGFGLIAISCLFPTIAIKEKVIKEEYLNKLKSLFRK